MIQKRDFEGNEDVVEVSENKNKGSITKFLMSYWKTIGPIINYVNNIEFFNNVALLSSELIA